jgi:CheY-like chemotaxis protein
VTENGRSAGRRRALVVDDDEAARSLIAYVLDEMGFDVTEAENADSAVSEFLGREYALITLDYRLPGLDGAEFHRVLSQEFGSGRPTQGFTPRSLPPVILVTGFPENPDVLRTRFGESVAGVVKKPFVEGPLRELVTEIFGPPAGTC